MIQLEGALRVKKIAQSRNGPFAVGTLTTGVGVFKVKDQLLDAFDEGDYQVTAWIAEFFLGQYVTGGRSITEIRASLNDLQVREERPLDEAGIEQDVEPDPLDEPPRRPVVHWPAPVQAPAAKASSLDALKAKLKSIGQKNRPAKAGAEASRSKEQRADALDQAREVFSDDLWVLIQARQPVKLDATIDRARYREQSRLLREQLNYEFKSFDQTFYPA